ncbi:hypothetical protein [Rhodobacter ferrooxidans]|uniref:Uncharacterized protein n=1 Tax=Rhodobacter ferrooxidans TaxID=371731 RepID=C8S4A9_9RHOB|nr:hypothetical protein [Rhodobacter sp. SW2]EEW24168.1 hypothetical protein Rsw2DRAFT_2887 [Rhodobacter sp. SW2]
MILPASSPKFEKRLRRSIADGRLLIADAINADDPARRPILIVRFAATAALGLLLAGFSILAVFVVLNLVFHFSLG